VNTREEKSQSAVNPVNRRITWLILGFAFLSLAASVLPLLPGIGRILPFELLERRGALTLYAVFIVCYMAMVFPTTLIASKKDATKKDLNRQLIGWWWVGSFMLGFSGVPLFVLAYIAGVSLKGVFAVLLWAGAFHGLATLWPRLFGFRSRPILVVANFLLLVVWPTLSRFGELFGAEPKSSTPMSLIVGITRDFDEPDLIRPGILMVLIYAALWVLCFAKSKSGGLKVMILAASAMALAFTSTGNPPGPLDRAFVSAQSVPVLSLTQGHHVSGRAFPLRLSGKPGQEIVVDISGRDEIRWMCPSTGIRSAWVFPSLQPGDDRIQIKSNDGAKIAEIQLQPLSLQKSLVLFLGCPSQSNTNSWVAIAHEGLMPLEDDLGYDPFGAIVCPSHFYLGLGAPQRKAVDVWTHGGGTLVLLDAQDDSAESVGLGQLVRTKGKDLPPEFRPDDRARHAEEANLYSDFLLPDWGQVDLSGLLLFLGIYHAVFYVIFLLPLVLDSKKSLGVYLCSVGFVLTLCVGGAYYTLKQTFLTENQILQQNICTWRLPTKKGASVQLHQESCFASFNGQPETLTFQMSDSPRLVHATGAPVGVKMTLSPDGQELELRELHLDRFAGKQVLKLARAADSPFVVESVGRAVKLRPQSGAKDDFGLLTARMRAAFYRHEGRLYPAQMRGNVIEVDPKSDSLIWQGVIPQDLRDANIVPFLRYSLGRHAGRKENVLVILLEGAKGLHDGDKYLARRDILQVILIGIDLPSR
jgi:hypothetical protein